MIAFITPETAAIVFWVVFLICTLLACWFSNTAFIHAVSEGEKPSVVRTIFYRRLWVSFSIAFILGILIYVFREPVFLDFMGIGQ